MFGDFTSTRWIAVVGILVGMSVCAACLLLVLVLNSTYGGQTVALRNPFARPTSIAQNNSNNTSGGSPASGSNTGGTSNSGSGASGVGSVPTTSSTNATVYLPSLGGYTTADANSITEALNFVGGTGAFSSQSADSNAFSAQSLSLSAIATSILVARVDDFIACYRATGAVDAKIYIENDLSALVAGGIPTMGAVVVANQDRLRESLVSCAVAPNDPNSFSAQSAEAQPCGSIGDFRANGNTFTYVYAGTSGEFCNAVAAYYGQFGG